MDSNQSSFLYSCASSLASSSFLGGNLKKGFWDKTLNFRTTVGRYFLLILLLTAGILPVVILLAQNIKKVYDAVEYLDTNIAVNNDVELALEIRGLVYGIQLERGLSALYVSSGGDRRTTEGMLKQRMKVDQTFHGLKVWPEQLKLWPDAVPTKSKMNLDLLAFRHDIDMQEVDDYDVVVFYSHLNAFLLQWMKTILHSVTVGTFWPDLAAFEELAIGTEHTGQERARGAIFFTRGYVSKVNLVAYIANVVIGRKSLTEASKFSTMIQHRLQQAGFQNTTARLNQFRDIVFNNSSGKRDSSLDHVDTAQTWIKYMTSYIDGLHVLQNELGAKIMGMTQKSSTIQRDITVHNSVLTVLEFLVYPVFVILTVRLTNSTNQFSVKLSERLKILAREQRRNATLVKEMYPPTVAHRLLKGKIVAPESFESATVCFSGLADFAELSRLSHGVDIIFFINRLFDLMDEEIVKHDVFKVETVADQYVVVSGLPVRNGEHHVAEAANMALGLLEQTTKLKVDHLPDYQIRLKFGLCSGPVVAGIVGLKMPRYCLFGDTVNVASRMLSTSEALRIHLSTTSGDLLMHNGNYDVQNRGHIQIKGKGLVQTFWLCGKYI